jgi:hypothetical protein
MAALEDWQIEPFRRYHEHHNRVAELLHTVQEALHFVQARPALIELLKSEWGEAKTAREVALAEHNAKVARAQADSGHPLLHAQAVVLMWGGLEVLMLDFLAQWLLRVPDVRQLEAVKHLKVEFGAYENLAPEDRANYLLERLEEKLGSRRAGGIERFEILFRTFGMTSAIEQQIAQDLLELSAVRNLLVHKGGIIDVRFRSQCPWVALSVGTALLVTHHDYHRYFDAADLYVFEIQQRLGARYGLPRTAHRPTCRFHDHEAVPRQ